MLDLKKAITGTLCATFLAFGSTAILAQETHQGTQSADPAQTTAPAEQGQVSDSQLALYAQVAQKVAQLQQQLQEDMQQAADAEEAQTVQAGAQQSMITAVESFGMTVEEYNHISTLVQTDPEVRARLETLLQQR